jgi:molecular chaperone HscA
LRLSGGVFEVLATRGDSRLGGDDFTNAIVEYWKVRYFSDANDLLSKVDFIANLNKLAEESKRIISAGNSYSGNAGGINLQLDRSILDELIKPLVVKTIECCRDALKDADIELSDIDEVIMVGGATRTPLVREMTASYFHKNVNLSQNPDEVVASGAAIQAAIIAGYLSEFLLLDVTPLAIGIEVGDGLMDVLIPRNSKIPCIANRLYTTQKDGQSGIRISVFQGGYTQVAKNLKIAEFTLSGIPLMPAGAPRILVTFSMDSSGILTVTALEQLTGISQNIIINSTLLITPGEEQAAPL